MSPQSKTSVHTSYNANGPFQGLDDGKLNCLFWNAGGLDSPKYSELMTILQRENIDIFAIVEAGFSTTKIDLLSHPLYNMHVLPRGRQIASGIIVGVKKTLTANFTIEHTMETTDKLELVKLNVWIEKEKRSFFFLYNPPLNKPDLSKLEEVITPRTIIVGDCNAPSTRWGYSRTTPVGDIFEDFLDSNPIELLEDPKSIGSGTFLTHQGSLTRPDLAFAHLNLLQTTVMKVIESPTGNGHRAIVISSLVEYENRGFKRVFRAPRWNMKKAKWNKYAKMSDIEVGPNLIAEVPDKSWINIKTAIWSCALACVPRGSMKRYQPFWNGQLSTLKSVRDKARRRAEHTGILEDVIDLKRKQACLKKEIISAKQKAVSSFLHGLDFRKDGIRAHNFISSLNNKQFEQTRPLIVNNRLITNNRDCAEALNKHYVSVGRLNGKRRDYRLLTKIVQQGCPTEESYNTFEAPFTIGELEASLRNSRRRKAAGPDEIPMEFYINLGPKAKDTILLLINQAWEKGLPAAWKFSEIIPILKKGKDPQRVDSFRPISLTNAISKICERMVVNRLEFYLETKHLLTERQAGFRKQRGTVEQVARLAQSIKNGFQRKQSTIAVYVDFKAAYDTVWREMVIHKLNNMNVSGHMLNWIKSFLSNRNCRVRYQNSRSCYRAVRQGLPQGGVISCLLFNVMVNDLIEHIQQQPGIESLLFADDLVLWATSSNIESIATELNKSLLCLQNWATSNRMLVNVEKTVCQLFTLSTKEYNFSLNYAGQMLKKQDVAKYLGVHLDTKLTWKAHAKETAEKGAKSLSLLKRLTGVKWGARQDVLSSAYKAYVRPRLEYGSELLSTASKNITAKIDKIQNQALRIITGAAKSTPIVAMQIQSGIQCLQTRREMATIKLRERLFRLPIDYWKNPQLASHRLKTQHTMLAQAAALEEKYHLNLKNRESRPRWLPASLKPPVFHLDLVQEVKKDEDPPHFLRDVAVKTIAVRYPEPEWLRIYTDGSATRENNHEYSVGFGVYCSSYSYHAALGRHCTNFDGEVAAIRYGAAKLTGTPGRAVFFVDSTAAILAISQPHDCETGIYNAAMAINRAINLGWKIVLQWVPSHVGIVGNELADKLAKKGSLLPPLECDIPLSSSYRLIKNKIDMAQKETWRQAAAGKKWESLLERPVSVCLKRKTAVAIFRMRTGHDFLQAHLHRIGVAPSPLCPLCNNSPMDEAHLTACTALTNCRPQIEGDDDAQAQLYWIARSLMAKRALESAA